VPALPLPAAPAAPLPAAPIVPALPFPAVPVTAPTPPVPLALPPVPAWLLPACPLPALPVVPPWPALALPPVLPAVPGVPSPPPELPPHPTANARASTTAPSGRRTEAARQSRGLVGHAGEDIGVCLSVRCAVTERGSARATIEVVPLWYARTDAICSPRVPGARFSDKIARSAAIYPSVLSPAVTLL
jgi:hypothetical protein